MPDTPAQIINRIERELALLKATLTGERFQSPRTGWKIVRGTHGISHVRDPEGSDPPPWQDG